MTNFEERLLLELRASLTAETAGGDRRRLVWRRPRLVLAGGIAAAVAVTAVAGVLFFSAGTQAAYAVTRNADGTVSVEVDSMTDAQGLQAALQAAGVNAVVDYLPAGKTCQQPWFTPAGPGSGMQQTSAGRESDGSTRFTISGDHPAGDTLVVTTQTGPGGAQALGIAWAKGEVPPCQVVDAPAGSGPLGGPPAGGGTQG